MDTSIQMKSRSKLAVRAKDWRAATVTPLLPRIDNEAGAPEALMAANVWWRSHPWPSPYDQTSHSVHVGDARELRGIANESIQLIVTSPPYFNLKPYASELLAPNSAASMSTRSSFRNWTRCGRSASGSWFREAEFVVWLVTSWFLGKRGGGISCCRFRRIFKCERGQSDSNLTPISWFKIGNRTDESGGGSSGFYGKPYQPGAVIKNDHEHILMLRKPGGYRTTDMVQKALSMLLRHEMDAWMRPVWSDIRGASLRDGHPAPYPTRMAERIFVRMFSFAGDTVLDPFAGSGSTALASIGCGRSSISIEIEPTYASMALGKMMKAARSTRLWGPRRIEIIDRLSTGVDDTGCLT